MVSATASALPSTTFAKTILGRKLLLPKHDTKKVIPLHRGNGGKAGRGYGNMQKHLDSPSVTGRNSLHQPATGLRLRWRNETRFSRFDRPGFVSLHKPQSQNMVFYWDYDDRIKPQAIAATENSVAETLRRDGRGITCRRRRHTVGRAGCVQRAAGSRARLFEARRATSCGSGLAGGGSIS